LNHFSGPLLSVLENLQLVEVAISVHGSSNKTRIVLEPFDAPYLPMTFPLQKWGHLSVYKVDDMNFVEVISASNVLTSI
jgi:hypothetical protein